MMKNYSRVMATAAAMLALALSAFGCGGDSSPVQTSTDPYGSIPNYGPVIDKAQDVAAQAEKQAQSQAQQAQDALNQATGSP